METLDHDHDESLDSYPGYLIGDRPRRDCRPVTITLTRSMLVLRHGETSPRHADTGDRCTVPAWTLGQLPPGSWDPAN